MAKKYAPVGRHCHAWHVGQEIFDLAHTDPLRAFGLGYLSHLAADAVAHNFFVPRQLVLTSSTAALGHSYWESRFETHLGPAYASTAKELILQDHTPSDTHLDTIISPTLFSVGTSRRLFRGMVHLTESESWRWAFQIILENTRWDLPDADVERHMAVAFEYVMEMLVEKDAAARRLDPAGDQALKLAKRMRRQALHEGGREDPERMLETAEHHFGLPTPPLAYWKQSQAQRPWRDRERDEYQAAAGRDHADEQREHQPTGLSPTTQSADDPPDDADDAPQYRADQGPEPLAPPAALDRHGRRGRRGGPLEVKRSEPHRSPGGQHQVDFQSARDLGCATEVEGEL